MKPLRTQRPILTAALALVLCAGATTAAVSALQAPRRGLSPGTVDSGVVDGNKTAPSLEADLAFAAPGRIDSVGVKEGDAVKAGQVLMKQDSRADEAMLRAYQADADVTARVKLAEQKRELADIQLKRKEQVLAGGGTNPEEVDEARINAAIAATQIDEEQRQGLVAAAKVDEQQARVDEKVLKSPYDGVVQRVDAAEGEVFGPQTPALKVVQIDPLYVKVILVAAKTVEGLKVGQTVQVRYGLDGPWSDAKLLYVEPRANLGDGDPLPFTLELPNPERRPAGLTVQIKLPGGGGAVVGSR